MNIDTLVLDCKVMTVTPEIAQRILERNTRNRPLNERRAKLLAQAIVRGEWALNGDTIRISATGVLLDGQHRLRAIVLSGITVESLIVTGLPDPVMKTIDVNGKGRGSADVLSMNGEKNYTHLAAVARLLFKFSASGNPYIGNPDISPTPTQIEQLIAEHPRLRESVASIGGGAGKLTAILTASIANYCHFVFSEKHPEKANEFFDALASGVGLAKGSPILLLRDRLSAAKGDVRTIKPHYKMALVFKAFKLFVVGSKCSCLKVCTEGDGAETNLFEI